MNRAEARALLLDELRKLKVLSHAELQTRVGKDLIARVRGTSGVEYSIAIRNLSRQRVRFLS